MKYYSIAGQVITLDLNDLYLHKNLAEFEVTKQPSDFIVSVIESEKVIEPSSNPLISSYYLKVYEEVNGFLMFYPTGGMLTAARYEQRNAKGTIYLSDNLSKEALIQTQTTIENTSLNIVDFIFFAIRDLFFLHIQLKGLLAVHSSSIIYKDKAYLFSACSGTGKTTHTDMWVERFGVDILDGDVTAISIENNQPYAYGLPWCGTSNRFVNRRLALGGIIFLAQSCHNYLSKLTPFEATLRLAARCFTPTWTKARTQMNLDIAEKMVSLTSCVFLGCLPNQEAVDLVKKHIDNL